MKRNRLHCSSPHTTDAGFCTMVSYITYIQTYPKSVQATEPTEASAAPVSPLPVANPLVCCCWKGGAPKGLLVTGCCALYALAMTDCTLSAKGLLLRPSRSSLGRAAPDVGVTAEGEAWDVNGLLAVAGVLEDAVVVNSFRRCSCTGNNSYMMSKVQAGGNQGRPQSSQHLADLSMCPPRGSL